LFVTSFGRAVITEPSAENHSARRAGNTNPQSLAQLHPTPGQRVQAGHGRGGCYAS
jgi:hypothetical protein